VSGFNADRSRLMPKKDATGSTSRWSCSCRFSRSSSLARRFFASGDMMRSTFPLVFVACLHENHPRNVRPVLPGKHAHNEPTE